MGGIFIIDVWAINQSIWRALEKHVYISRVGKIKHLARQ
jgi:hypothetical protein